MITLANLESLFPITHSAILEIYVDPLNQFLPKYEINTNLRISMFLAQIGVESAFFTAIEGNYNYSAKRLLEVFPLYFDSFADAELYAYQPEKICIAVYGGRMGNLPVPSNDAWVYRERGLIQLTGKDNYAAFAKYKNMTLDQVVTYLGTTDACVEVACWFFNTRGLNAIADDGDVVKATKLINGGTIGLNQREALYTMASKLTFI